METANLFTEQFDQVYLCPIWSARYYTHRCSCVRRILDFLVVSGPGTGNEANHYMITSVILE